MKIKMNRKMYEVESVKARYEAPKMEVLAFATELSLLVSLSAEGGIGDWEEGDEL